MEGVVSKSDVLGLFCNVPDDANIIVGDGRDGDIRGDVGNWRAGHNCMELHHECGRHKGIVLIPYSQITSIETSWVEE